jgi:serine/threonine-protein kinase
VRELTPDPRPLSSRRIGRVLAGRWRLERLIGEGGAGAVYQARGPDGAVVAVKMLHRSLADEPSIRARFVREAYVANTVAHDGAVRVLEDGVDAEDVPYLVMELLEGENYEARRVRKGGRLPVDEVLWVADRTLAVLAEAHKRGIVHRDIKPENLFLTGDRRLKVLDFGIARLSDGGTGAGAILGTLAYMPPEQARGAIDEIGVHSDLWSVGATMYTLLSGRHVRDDHDLVKVLREAGAAQIPSLRTVVDDLPAELVNLVDDALRLDLDGRWPTARAMRRAVHVAEATTKRRPDRPGSEDDGEAVSEPLFGVIGMHSIEPPPPSVAYDGGGARLRVPAAAVPAMDPPHREAVTLPESEAKPPRTAATTLSSARDVDRGAAVVVEGTDPPGAGAPAPSEAAGPVGAADARPAEAVRKTTPPTVAWLVFAAAMLAVVVLLVLLVRR